MPSHPDRVRQNYCDHIWPYMDRELFFDNQDVKDGRKCISCGADWDKIHNTVKFKLGPIQEVDGF